ncbi:hypothetical protein AVEN_183355-1 [Araneus ventricosus]|uniref:Ig-like domain-containing protein n=1 Tax=Araneus ventricosus TaxID=182803 RepID=A0A4Y2TD02_ARAVE|nr:hypothetical protein AVEN_122977-1 [Araneus ventricosus]GBN98472.1 hypothetical protein AVEN_183355-1 [Araneus ventricosus]
MATYSNQEKADMHFMYGLANGNDLEAERKVKRDPLSPAFAAHFTNKFHAEIVKKGQDAKLSCEAYGERPLTILWTKDKQPLNAKLMSRYRQTETVFTNGTLSELLIESVDRSDSALFTCLARNSYGKDESNIQLIIQGTSFQKFPERFIGPVVPMNSPVEVSQIRNTVV